VAATRDINTTKPTGPVAAQLPPENIPISGGGAWRRFFEGLWRRVGGFQDDVYNGFVDSAGTLARMYQLEQDLQAANFEAAAARQLVFSLLADRREIEELRFQVATAQQQTGTLSQQLVRFQEERAKDAAQTSFQSQSQYSQMSAYKRQLDQDIDAINDTFSSRVRTAISVSGSLSYSSGTGVISYTQPTYATVATTGAYADLSGLPTLGTAAAQNTGTSGANVPLLNGANTWSALQTFSADVKFGTYTASAAPPITGYITITDAGGTSRNLAVV
jgi:hypothetical protein